jgi:hypothetical protein
MDRVGKDDEVWTKVLKWFIECSSIPGIGQGDGVISGCSASR